MVLGGMNRQDFLRSISSGATIFLCNYVWAEANESSTKEVLALPGLPSLEFRTALPEGLDWFEGPEPVVSFEDTGEVAPIFRAAISLFQGGFWFRFRPPFSQVRS